jgi:tetratricopeptide (TPR) repeat protein
VIVHYLRLAVWPEPLVLDYGWPLAETASAIVPWATVIVVLLVATALALYRQFWAGFWGAWFFLILAPTSSIYPIADIAFEHRMYLPLAAVAVLAVIGAYRSLEWGLGRLAAPDSVQRWLAVGLVAMAVLVLVSATARRNADYRSDFAIWTDIVAKRPGNPRAHFALGNVLDRQGRPQEAVAQYVEALRLKPDYAAAHVNLGAILLGQNQVDEAITHLTEAVRLKPNDDHAHTNLGAALFSQGKVAEAITHLSDAVRLNPNSAEAHYNLAVALTSHGQLDEAIGYYSKAVQLDPSSATTHVDFANALVRKGRLEEAIAHYSEALRINPNLLEARTNRSTVMARLGKPTSAR